MATLTLGMEIIKGEYPEMISRFGYEMKSIGKGAYPYECVMQDRYPTAMIYKNAQGGWYPLYNGK